MGVIYLVRHGQADPNAYGIVDPAQPASRGHGGLTDIGALQAQMTGTLLATLTDRVTAAVSGDLPRQRQTLGGILDQFPDAPEPVVDTGWNEYELPALAGSATVADFRDGRGFQRRLDEGLLEWISGGGEHGAGETYQGFVQRVSDAADRARQLAGSGATVVVVSSAGTISQWVCQLWGIPAHRWPAVSRTMINASLSTLIVGRSGVSAVSFNEHAHLCDRDGGISTYR